MANTRVVYAPVFPDLIFAPAFLPTTANPRHANGAGLAGSQITGFDASNPALPVAVNNPSPTLINGVLPTNYTGEIQVRQNGVL
jgi:hypothetical protein